MDTISRKRGTKGPSFHKFDEIKYSQSFQRINHHIIKIRIIQDLAELVTIETLTPDDRVLGRMINAPLFALDKLTGIIFIKNFLQFYPNRIL